MEKTRKLPRKCVDCEYRIGAYCNRLMSLLDYIIQCSKWDVSLTEDIIDYEKMKKENKKLGLTTIEWVD